MHEDLNRVYVAPAGKLVDTETATISSEGGGRRRTQVVIRKVTLDPAKAVRYSRLPYL